MNAGLPPQSAAGRLPPPSSTAHPAAVAPFPPGMSASQPRGVPPASLGQMHQMPPMPGAGGQRPAVAMPPPRPPGAQQLPTTGPSVSTLILHVSVLFCLICVLHWMSVPCLYERTQNDSKEPAE